MLCEDYERPQFYLSRNIKARKEHKCNECHCQINKGDIYENVSGKWDGQIETFKTCRLCIALKNYTLDNIRCTCWNHGTLIQDCIESIREHKIDSPGILFGVYRILVNINKIKKSQKHGN